MGVIKRAMVVVKKKEQRGVAMFKAEGFIPLFGTAIMAVQTSNGHVVMVANAWLCRF